MQTGSGERGGGAGCWVIGCSVGALVLTVAGLIWQGFDAGRDVLTYLLWIGFVLLCALGQAAALLLGGPAAGARTSWNLAAVGVGGLVGYWVLVVLPTVPSNASFLLTAGAGLGVAALWLAPGRPR